MSEVKETLKLIQHRVGEFSVETPPMAEIDEFYTLEKVDMPSDRPYIWSNTIISLDGVVSVGQGVNGVKILSLRTLPNSQARTDFKLLAAGWAYADAILFSAATLRAEPEQKLLIPMKELIEYRKNVLKIETVQPKLIMVTSSGWIDLKHPIFATDRCKLIVTSKDGYLKIIEEIIKNHPELKGETNEQTHDAVVSFLEKEHITLKAFPHPTNPLEVDLPAMARFAKSDWGVNTIDISAGPTLISLMMKAKLVDECRYTTSGIVVGRDPTGGDGIEEPDHRPLCYPSPINNYASNQWPLLQFVGLRMFGPYHVYHRGVWQYRH